MSPPGDQPSPRRATTAEVPAVARTLARAFYDDPIARWSCPPDRLRMGMLERFYETRLRQVLSDDEAWIDGAATGAALWLPPERWKTSVREDLELARCMTHPRLLRRMPLVLTGLKAVERQHPTEPHWYLAVLGTDPAAQGRGIGSALLAPVLDSCDEDGIGAYLESSKQANIAFYARHGFKVVGEHRLPRGPRFWLMWRDPR